MKRILSFFLTLVLTAALLCPAALAVNETAAKDRNWVYITLDPGHGGDGAGGNDSGAVNEKKKWVPGGGSCAQDRPVLKKRSSRPTAMSTWT